MVITIRAYIVVVGLPRFKARKPEIDWAAGQLTSFMTPSVRKEVQRSGMKLQWYEGWDDEGTNIQLPDSGGSTPIINLTLEIPVDPNGNFCESSENSPKSDIEVLWATAFDELSASNGTMMTFALQFGECGALPGPTMDVTTLKHPSEIEIINRSAGRAGRELWELLWQNRDPAWVHFNDCNCLAKSWQEVVGLAGLCLLLGKPLDLLVPGFLPHHLSKCQVRDRS